MDKINKTILGESDHFNKDL